MSKRRAAGVWQNQEKLTSVGKYSENLNLEEQLRVNLALKLVRKAHTEGSARSREKLKHNKKRKSKVPYSEFEPIELHTVEQIIEEVKDNAHMDRTQRRIVRDNKRLGKLREIFPGLIREIKDEMEASSELNGHPSRGLAELSEQNANNGRYLISHEVSEYTTCLSAEPADANFVRRKNTEVINAKLQGMLPSEIARREYTASFMSIPESDSAHNTSEGADGAAANRSSSLLLPVIETGEGEDRNEASNPNSPAGPRKVILNTGLRRALNPEAIQFLQAQQQHAQKQLRQVSASGTGQENASLGVPRSWSASDAGRQQAAAAVSGGGGGGSKSSAMQTPRGGHGGHSTSKKQLVRPHSALAIGGMKKVRGGQHQRQQGGEQGSGIAMTARPASARDGPTTAIEKGSGERVAGGGRGATGGWMGQSPAPVGNGGELLAPLPTASRKTSMKDNNINNNSSSSNCDRMEVSRSDSGMRRSLDQLPRSSSRMLGSSASMLSSSSRRSSRSPNGRAMFPLNSSISHSGDIHFDPHAAAVATAAALYRERDNGRGVSGSGSVVGEDLAAPGSVLLKGSSSKMMPLISHREIAMASAMGRRNSMEMFPSYRSAFAARIIETDEKIQQVLQNKEIRAAERENRILRKIHEREENAVQKAEQLQMLQRRESWLVLVAMLVRLRVGKKTIAKVRWQKQKWGNGNATTRAIGFIEKWWALKRIRLRLKRFPQAAKIMRKYLYRYYLRRLLLKRNRSADLILSFLRESTGLSEYIRKIYLFRSKVIKVQRLMRGWHEVQMCRIRALWIAAEKIAARIARRERILRLRNEKMSIRHLTHLEGFGEKMQGINSMQRKLEKILSDFEIAHQESTAHEDQQLLHQLAPHSSEGTAASAIAGKNKPTLKNVARLALVAVRSNTHAPVPKGAAAEGGEEDDDNSSGSSSSGRSMGVDSDLGGVQKHRKRGKMMRKKARRRKQEGPVAAADVLGMGMGVGVGESLLTATLSVDDLTLVEHQQNCRGFAQPGAALASAERGKQSKHKKQQQQQQQQQKDGIHHPQNLHMHSPSVEFSGFSPHGSASYSNVHTPHGSSSGRPPSYMGQKGNRRSKVAWHDKIRSTSVENNRKFEFLRSVLKGERRRHIMALEELRKKKEGVAEVDMDSLRKFLKDPYTFDEMPLMEIAHEPSPDDEENKPIKYHEHPFFLFTGGGLEALELLLASAGSMQQQQHPGGVTESHLRSASMDAHAAQQNGRPHPLAGIRFYIPNAG